MIKHFIFFVSILTILGIGKEAQGQDPVYIRIDNGWKGFYPRNDQFVEYSIIGNEVKLQDPYHILIKPGLGLMVTFAEKSNFKSNLSLLEAHRKWEVDYWKSISKSVEIKDRIDLRGNNNHIMITELKVQRFNVKNSGTIYLIGIPAKDGVFVFAFSPVTSNDESTVKLFINSIKVVDGRLDIINERNKIVK
jgi:hypothetical protein